MERDKEITPLMEEQGWLVLHFWGKQIKKETASCADIIEKAVLDI